MVRQNNPINDSFTVLCKMGFRVSVILTDRLVSLLLTTGSPKPDRTRG